MPETIAEGGRWRRQASHAQQARQQSRIVRQRVEEPPRRPFHLRIAMARLLSNTRVALPLDPCHFAGRNIDFEWAIMANPESFPLD
jgi:hypothetical protein